MSLSWLFNSRYFCSCSSVEALKCIDVKKFSRLHIFPISPQSFRLETEKCLFTFPRWLQKKIFKTDKGKAKYEKEGHSSTWPSFKREYWLCNFFSLLVFLISCLPWNSHKVEKQLFLVEVALLVPITTACTNYHCLHQLALLVPITIACTNYHYSDREDS